MLIHDRSQTFLICPQRHPGGVPNVVFSMFYCLLGLDLQLIELRGCAGVGLFSYLKIVSSFPITINVNICIVT